jgi:hypothetical protein
MFCVYDAIRDVVVAPNETALSSALLVEVLGNIKASTRHESVKLQALDENGRVLAEFKTVNW